MELENYTEILVDEAIKDFFRKNEDIAAVLTSTELIEIKAFALNQLPPHYVTSQMGYAFTKLEEVNIQTKVTVLKTVVMAVDKILNNRRTKE